MPSKIPWCDETVNPVVGCSKCSPGCDNCYAEKMAFRLSRMSQTAAKYAGVVDEAGRWTGKISRLDLSVFDRLPQKPCSVFVGSMTDIFHDNAQIMDVRDIFLKISEYQNWNKKFIFLTKRPKNMMHIINEILILSPFCDDYMDSLPKNIEFGVTICNQNDADALAQISLPPIFLSIEPMLGEIYLANLSRYFWATPRINGVIVGGETGHKARPMHPDWVRRIRDQCSAAGVPFFFKSWGEWLSVEDLDASLDYGDYKNGFIDEFGFYTEDEEPRSSLTDQEFVARVGKKISGRLLDGVEHNELPWAVKA